MTAIGFTHPFRLAKALVDEQQR